MRNVTESPRLEGYEQRLLDELKIMVAQRQVDVVDPVGAQSPAGRSPFRMPVWRRAGLVAAAALAAGSMAVAGLFAGGLFSGVSVDAGGEHVELTTFLARAAADARSHPVVLPKPGQVLVERVTGSATFPTRTGPCGAKTLTPFRSEVSVATPVSGGFTGIDLKPDHGAHGYPDPARLPVSPAALFEVTGRLHGITLDRHATDLIGRPGAGIALSYPVKGSPDGIRPEFVVNPKTYQFLGLAMTDSLGSSQANPAKYGYAVIKSGLITPKH
jgi:hypothetical protein